jgi:NadR type nicotinamide-nucleotide adenylyltransferase
MRFSHGLVVGKFYPPHAGHHHLISSAAARCETVTVVVAPRTTESIPLEERLRWLREAHADEPHVSFVGIYDDHPVDYTEPDVWDLHEAVFRQGVGNTTVDAVFSSEEYGGELARRFDAVHVPVDPARGTHPVSGTAIRKDPVAHWRHLKPAVRAWYCRRVVVVGAESTGTTRLSRALAVHFRLRGGDYAATPWVPEYGREVSEKRALDAGGIEKIVWTPADFADIALRQNQLEDAAARAGSPLVVCDTDAFATAIWQERYLAKAEPEVKKAARPPALYLLTSDVGVPFVDDGFRDGEHLRSWMTGRFREELAAQSAPWLELTGPYRARLDRAVRAIDELA